MPPVPKNPRQPSQELNAQAEGMKHMVQGLVELVEGVGSGSAPLHTSRENHGTQKGLGARTKAVAPAAAAKGASPENIIPF